MSSSTVAISSFAEDEAATSRLFQHVLRSYASGISREERKLVDDFAERSREHNVAGISTLNIKEQGHARKLGPEIKRLLFLKHDIRKRLKYVDRIYYDDSDDSEVLLHELIDRHNNRAEATSAAAAAAAAIDAGARPCTDRSHMDMLERECPLLCAKGSAYRKKIAKGLLETNVEPKMVIMEIELLRMVEDGELEADEASMVLSKILMDPTQFHNRLLESVRPSASFTAAAEQPRQEPPAAATTAASTPPKSDMRFGEYCAKRDLVKKTLSER